MAFLNSLNIVGSALTAERFRSDVILQNFANDPYRGWRAVPQETGRFPRAQYELPAGSPRGAG